MRSAILGRMLAFRCLFLLILAVGGVLEAQKAPITHEDVWLMKRVGAPRPSPDGQHVVVSVTEPAYAADEQISDLWIVPAQGSAAPRRLTSSKASESGVAWSPDSKRIAFSTRREGDEQPQIYILSLEGGEAQRVTNLSTGAFSPSFSPDGKSLLFQSQIYRGAADDEANRKIGAERKARKYNVRTYESYPIRFWDRWLDEARATHLFVLELQEGSKPRDLLASTKLAALPGFAGSSNPDTGVEDLKPAWAPDGQWIVFQAVTNKNVTAYDFTNSHLYRIPVKGGEPEQITTGDDSYGEATFRPDGKALYALHSRSPKGGQLYSLSRLVKLAWPPKGDPVMISGQVDRAVDSFAFSPDSSTVYFTAEEHGHDKLYVLPAEGGQGRLAFEVKSGGYSALSIPQKTDRLVLVASWGSMTSPAEAVVIDPQAGNHRALTQFTAERSARIDWRPPIHFWFTSKAGARIHNMLVLPPNFDDTKKYPLIVFMHGGPHNMWKDAFFLRWNYHFLASPGYVVLMTNYTGSTGFGEKFADAINRDVLRGPANEINEAADEAIRRYPFIDGTRQAAGGASYGGYLANWMQATTTRYRALFNHAGLTNNESMWGTTDGGFFWERRYGSPVWEGGGQWQAQNPFRYAANFKTPMLITHGEWDFRVPIGQAFEIYKLLSRQRVPTRLVVFPDENHWILKGENSKYFFQEVFAWLARYLK